MLQIMIGHKMFEEDIIKWICLKSKHSNIEDPWILEYVRANIPNWIVYNCTLDDRLFKQLWLIFNNVIIPNQNTINLASVI